MREKIILELVKIVVFSLLFLTFGCATNPALKVRAFQAEEVRNVRILLITNDRNVEKVREAIIEASHLIEPQVGIRLEVTQNIIIDEHLPLLGRENVIRRIIQIVGQHNLRFGRSFDIAIWVGDYSTVDLLFSAIPIPLPYFWRGIIDKWTCRCVIAVKSFDARIIAHEVIHSFMLDSKHGWGLERGLIIEVLPGVPIIPLGFTLSSSERTEVIKYKWRGFPELPKNPPIALVLDPAHSP